jgi:hypothetical protein
VSDEIESVVVGTLGLSALAVVAVWLTIARERVESGSPSSLAVVPVAVTTWLVQAAHFVEELVTGFHRRFPELMGLSPWPPGFFVSFNLVWLVLWAFSCRTIASGSRPAAFGLWFLSLAGLVNGVAHPLLAAATGGYFPGLFTSPLVGLAGVQLLRRLVRATAPAGAV